MSPRRQGRGAGRGQVLLAVACSVLAAAGVGLVSWVLTHQVSAPQAPAAGASSWSAARPTGAPRRSPSNTTTPSSPRRSSASSTVTALPRSLPTEVMIPAIDVSSRLLHLGQTPSGAIQVPQPPHYNQAAWYTGSPTPGERGPAVIEGHIDGVGTTPSVFFKLGALTTGDTVNVVRADGHHLTFTVYRTARYPKDDFPTGIVYGNTPGPELRLITCGGDLDQSTGHYTDNQVIYARLTTIH